MKQVVVILLFLLKLSAISAQVSPDSLHYDRQAHLQPVSFEAKDFIGYKIDKAFNYEEADTAVDWWESFKNWLGQIWMSFWQWLFGDIKAGSFIAFLVRYLPYLILLAIVGFAIYLFVKANPGKDFLESKAKGKTFLSEEEKIIEKDDIKSLISRALENNNYRLAVRYYYLLILKKLKENDYIDYQYQKTNTDYLAEIESIKLQQQFYSITHLYEYIWYGDFTVNHNQYKMAEVDFKKIETTLNQASHG